MAVASKLTKLLIDLGLANSVKGDVGLTIKAASSQTANLAEFKNSAGTVLYAIDPNGQPVPPASPTQATVGVAQYVVVSLTNAQIKALRATPASMVGAPGAGRMIEFLSAVLLLKAGANVLTESTANLAFKYTNGAGVQVSQTVECTGFIDQAADTITSAEAKIDAIVAKSAADNAALVLHNLGGGEFAGNAAADATLKVRINYRVHLTT
jgi:hypothetical protein